MLPCGGRWLRTNIFSSSLNTVGKASAIKEGCGYGRDKKCVKCLRGIPEGRRPFGRPRLRWGNNIKIKLDVIGQEVWTGFVWLRIRISIRTL
jgi:hypothetical protein